jgi:hypothetical protein
MGVDKPFPRVGPIIATGADVWARLQLSWARFWGRVANLVGIPAFVRECDYRSSLGVVVRVRKGRLFTVVTVDDVEIFFYRLTGRIDGVALSSPPDCTGSDTSG